MLLTETATGNHRLAQLQDELSARRRTLRQMENHHQGMVYRLSDPGENPTTPPIEHKKRKKAREDFKAEAAEIARITGELQARQREFDELTDTVNKAQRRCAEIQAAIDAERQIRVAAAVSQAAEAAPSRDDAHAAREKLYRLRARHTQIERELGMLMAAPRQESVAQRATELLATEIMPAEVKEHSEEIKRFILEEKTVRVALGLQEREVRRLERKYGGELYATLRPTFAKLAGRISDGLDMVRDSGKESEQLRVAASVEAGSSDVIAGVHFPYLQPDYGDSSDMVRQWQRRMRIEGLLV